MKLSKAITHLEPCREAVEWMDTQKSRKAAWENCERGDWMLWLAGRLSGEPESASRCKLVLCACECARLSLKHVPKGEDRPRLAIETAERWARREKGVAIEDVRKSAAAASAAAASASAATYAAAYAASAATYAAAYAADAADASAATYAAAYAASAATYAAAYAADAADAATYAAAYAAHSNVLSQCADIVRKHYPKS